VCGEERKKKIKNPDERLDASSFITKLRCGQRQGAHAQSNLRERKNPPGEAARGAPWRERESTKQRVGR
jgi:hypothetical protein